VERSERIAAGKGGTEQEAMASAIGEAVERYCAYQWNPARTFAARLADLAMPAVTPAECVLYSAEQYAEPEWRYAPWRDDQEVTWVRGVELPSGAPVALPASLTYLVSPPPRPEEWYAPATSNGLAAGPSVAAAALGGLYELMERDALLVTWMNRLPAVELELGHAAAPVAAIHRHYARIGVEVRAFLLPTDLPAAVVMAVSFEDAPERPGQVIGMGCHRDPNVALRKAVFELCQGRPAEARRFLDQPPHGRLVAYADVRTLDDHSAFCGMPEHRGEFAFLWAHGRSARPRDLPNPATGDAEHDLRDCAAALAALGSRVACAELTTPDLRGYDMHVVRTIATGLQPVHFGHGEARLGGDRLFAVPHRLGLADRRTTPAELNPCPHPLA
jgi:ribosomal protein S12 methylthiotransferase accessory factor